MSSRFWIAFLAVVVACGFSGAAVQAQEEHEQGGMSQEQMEEMAAWMKAGTPNEHHERLNHFVGSWECAVKMWNPGVDTPAESTAKETNEWVLGGRYLVGTFAGNFMGMPFEGRSITGYDNINERYYSIWMDSMSTGFMSQKGAFDAASKTYTYTGTFDSPMGKTMHNKMELKMVSKDQHMMTMWHGESPGALEKAMEIMYTRAGKAAAAGKASAKLASRTVEVGSAMCVYHMDGAKGCTLAAKVDGKTYMVTGSGITNDQMHKHGLCGGTKMATIDGRLAEADLIATSVTFLP